MAPGDGLRADTVSTGEVEAVRRFNRFYTQQIGILSDALLGSPLALPEARVLFEVAQHDESSPGDVVNVLGMDRGYLSRLLKKLEGQALLERRRSETDGRRQLVTLTAAGRGLYEEMTARSNRQVASMLGELSTADRRRLLDALRTVEGLLSPAELLEAPCVLRGPGPGDAGHLIERHGVIYAREQGFDERFEGVVAEIMGAYLRDHDPQRERFWIAEIAGRPVGTVMLVAETEKVARLRVLLVEREARGRAVGKLLVEECVGFARSKGYERIRLSTVSRLRAARHLYERTGFRLVREERAQRWSQDVVDEEWELDLRLP